MIYKKKSADELNHQQIKETIRIYTPNGNVYGYDQTALIRNSLQKRIERQLREKLKEKDY